MGEALVDAFALRIMGAVDSPRGLIGGLSTIGFARAFAMFSGFMIPVSAQVVPILGGMRGESGGDTIFRFLLLALFVFVFMISP